MKNLTNELADLGISALHTLIKAIKSEVTFSEGGIYFMLTDQLFPQLKKNKS